MCEPMLLKKFIWSDRPQDPKSFYLSEKLDGIRAISRNGSLISRGGIHINTPIWFSKQLPKDAILDGELYAGKGNFEKVQSLAKRKGDVSAIWKKFHVKYHVFDILNLKGKEVSNKPFSERNKILKELSKTFSKDIRLIKQHSPKTWNEVERFYKEKIKKGGEGIVLHKKDGIYKCGKRSNSIFKLKPKFTAEAKVVDFIEGKGKWKNHLGAFKVCLPLTTKSVKSPICFSLSGKIPEKLRKQYIIRNGQILQTGHIKKGATVTFSFMNWFPSGKPRQPVFQHERTCL